MTRISPRTNFHSSKLIRCLADLAIIDTADSGNAFAEKLGSWTHFADAITLSAVHNDSTAITSKPRSDTLVGVHTAIRIEFDRVQAATMNSITKSFAPNFGNLHIALPAPPLELPIDMRAAYVPYRRFYEAHQRDMELIIQPLRASVRGAVAKVSPRLRKLAELDATFEKILRERENKLLARVPALLMKRFEELVKEHQHRLVTTQQADSPAMWPKEGGWLARFCNDMQRVLLAEMELRLQPAMGLIEALEQDTQ